MKLGNEYFIKAFYNKHQKKFARPQLKYNLDAHHFNLGRDG